MKNRLLILLLFSALFSMHHAYAQSRSNMLYWEKVNIETEMCGAFSKNRAEFYFYNDTKIDENSLFCDFVLNSSAFVTKMWLEIEEELVEDETFRRDTGESIYSQIVNRRVDPALLTKISETQYSLRVFPFKAFERRRVVIEYYSVLETLDDELTWIFKAIRPYKKDYPEIQGNFNFILPENAIVKHENKNVEYQNDKNMELKSYQQMTLQVQFSENSVSLVQKEEFRDLESVKQIYSTPDFIKMFISTGKRFKLYKNENTTDTFLEHFLLYIEKNHSARQTYNQIFANWFSSNDSFYYFDPNMNLSFIGKERFSSQNQFSQDCPFLKHYFQYNEAIETDIAEHWKSGFLTYHTAKLVLEKEERAQRIRKNTLEKEGKYYPRFINQPAIGQTSRFTIYENAPEVIKMIKPQISNELWKLLSPHGDVVLRLEILLDGRVGAIEIAKSAHPYLDYLVMNAVKQWEFTPAHSGGHPVSCWVTFPVYFVYEKEILTDNDIFHLFGREFIIQDNALFEKGFNQQNSRKVMLLSDEFFDILIENYDIVDISYLFHFLENYSLLGIRLNSDEDIIIEK